MKKLILLAFAFAFLQCQSPKPKAAISTSNDIKPGKYNVTFTGQMTVEEIGVINPPDTIPTPPIPTTPGKFFLGCNSNHYQDKDKQIGFDGIRLYLPIGWVFTERGMYAQPMLQAQKQFLGIDNYLAYMQANQRDVVLCLMQSPDFLNGHTAGWITNDWPPIRLGLDRKNPASWNEVAQIYKAFAIRYGAKKWPKGSYKVDPAGPRWNGDSLQVEKSGLNLVKTIEVGNEVDRWWNPDQYLQPEEYAAMLMACYDAIKSADQNMEVLMCGLTNLDFVYLEKMNAVFKSKGREFLSRAINVHRYSSAGNRPGVHPPTWPQNQAVSVEQDPGISDFARVMAFAKSVNRPVWVTECGYDSRPGSQMTPTPQSGKTGEQIQAEWLPRAALEYTRMGAERVYVYHIADEPNPDAGLYASSGALYGESKGYAEKPAYASVTALVSILRGMRFTKDESTATARIMRFDSNTKAVWVYWSPTADGRTFQTAINGQSVTVTEAPKFLSVGQ